MTWVALHHPGLAKEKRTKDTRQADLQGMSGGNSQKAGRVRLGASWNHHHHTIEEARLVGAAE